MDKSFRMSLLFDFYSCLLTKRQQDVFRMYFNENMSLGEIGEQLDVSRQAVYDILKRSETALEELEDKLTLLKRYHNQQKTVKDITDSLNVIKRALQDKNLYSEAKELDGLRIKIRKIFTEEEV